MTLDELCQHVRDYLESLPTEGGRYDSWRERLDQTLADVRAQLSSVKDGAEASHDR